MKRATRTGAVTAELGADWIGPYWFERERDPRSPAPPRTWTTLGTVGSSATGVVDPRGLLAPSTAGWSLDWWIGAEDRWHFPSREAAVRQQLIAETPVVETAMRIPGGDALQRVYGVPEGLAVMEITNATPTPIAVGLAIRPYTPMALSPVERIGLQDTRVTVDGCPAVLLPKRPLRMAASTFADGDAVHRLLAEDLATELRSEVRCRAGRATATFLLPLAHRQTLRVVVALSAESQLRSDVPDSDAVVRSWQAQTSSRGLRLVLPEGRLAAAVDASRRALLLTDESEALDLYGFHHEAADAARQIPQQAEHWRLTGSLDHVDALSVAKAAGKLERRRRKQAGDPATVRALADASDLLEALGTDAVAVECRRWADAARAELEASVVDVAEALPAAAATAGPPRPAEVHALGLLTACGPLGVWPADHARSLAVADTVRRRFCVGPAVHDGASGAGLDPIRTLQLATIELDAGERTALERLAWVVDTASETFTWAAHASTAAAFLTLVRRSLVRETPGGGLALCTMLPDAWAGQNLEVHDAPTHVGSVSFAVRYHGARPALLWDVKLRNPGPPVRITAPGLDPAWSTTDPKGEALLAAAHPIGGEPIPTGGSFN